MGCSLRGMGGFRALLLLAAFGVLLLALAACQSEPTVAPTDAGASAAAPTAVPAAEPTAEPAAGSRLEEVRRRGQVICASNNAIPGFGFLDASGNNAGFDIDLCRAVAAAVLGQPNIEIRPINATEMGATLQSGEVDLLVRTVTTTLGREAQWGNFTLPLYYDGQGFLIRKDLGIASALELAGAKICVTQGTTTELNLQDFSNQHGLNIEALTFEKTDVAVDAYHQGQCDGFTTDHSGLYAYRSEFADRDDHIVLPETISEEPLAPAVPHGDEQWYDLVKTVMAILIYAEAYGISSDNLPEAATGNAAVDRLLGFAGSYGQEALGLSPTAAGDVIRAVGNYAEVFERSLGEGGIGLPRGRNALWADAPCAACPKGGQLYAPPLR